MKLAATLVWALLAELCQGQDAPIKITLERTGCFGSCPSYVLEVNDDGTATFTGRNPVVAPGERRASIPKETVQDLARTLQSAGFFEMPESNGLPVLDAPGIVLGVSIGARHKTVRGYAFNWPELEKLAQSIDDAAGVDRWLVHIPYQPLLHDGLRNEVLKLPLRLAN